MKPKYLILDEPTTGLDARAERDVVMVIKELRNEGHGILLITHDIDLVLELAERVVLLHKGIKLFDGPVEEFFSPEIEEFGLEMPRLLGLSKRLGVPFVRTIDELVSLLGGRVL
jgi:energy-coupling factor transport system ATP-binding protein